MRFNIIWLGVLMTALLRAPVAGAVQLAPLEVYGQLPTMENVALSPSGKRLAWVKTIGDERVLSIYDLADGKALRLARIGNAKLRSLRWADEDTVMITVSVTAQPVGLAGPKQEWALLNLYDIRTQQLRRVDFKMRDVTTLQSSCGAPMVRQQEGATIIFVCGMYLPDDVNEFMPALFRVEAATGKTTIVDRGSEPWVDWQLDASGAVVASTGYRQEIQRWSLKVWHGRRFIATVGHSALDPPSIEGLTPDGDALLIQVGENGAQVWRTASLQDGSLGAEFSPAADLDRSLLDSRTGRVIGGIVEEEGGPRYRFFDQRMQSQWDSIVGERQEVVRLVSATADFSSVIVEVFNRLYGYNYQMWNLATGAKRPIGELYDGMKRLAEVEVIHYPAGDGLEIPAYLTMPPGRVDHDLPLVVLPHGGPEARDSAGFDWWAQALAAQGYAVLQPNYRGSSLGTEFVSKGFGEWGRKMQTDLSDGVRYLASKGTVDPKRVCIVGASYGGYAALAGATLDTGVYRCAISVGGISDLRRWMKWIPTKTGSGNSLTGRYWNRFMGIDGAADRKLDEISPIEHVDRVTVPILLIHGRDDTVVPFEQSQRMADGLKRASKPVELVELKQEDHWLSRSATRLQMLQATTAFLRVNNPPDE